MNARTLKTRRFPRPWRSLLLVIGLALLAWQIVTFLDVVQAHTAQAHTVSQSASWAGKPVGTMPQAPMRDEQRVPARKQEALNSAHIMHTALP